MKGRCPDCGRMYDVERDVGDVEHTPNGMVACVKCGRFLLYEPRVESVLEDDRIYDGDFIENLDELMQAAERDSQNGGVQLDMALLYAKARELKEENENEQYLNVVDWLDALEESNRGSLKELAADCLTRKQYKRALGLLFICARRDPNDVEALRMLAWAYEKSGNPALAKFAYKRIARLYLAQGEVVRAHKNYKRVLEHNPDDIEAKRALKETREDDQASAEKFVKEVVQQRHHK